MSERSITQLLQDLKTDAQALAQEETALAKAEVKEGATNLGIGAGLAIVALFLLFLSSFMALFAGAAGFHEGLGWPWWASFLIVFGILVVIAVVLVLVALPLFKKGNPTPGRAIDGAKTGIDLLKRAVKNATA
ncbi:phage holin family protein [Brevibacterium samyangense]|uniref:Holin-X, holin superfamily III n=1 Tax=Brevibacterium samyangense TaxID=366888 RepID=A0ABP5EHY0_9MICO